MSGDVQPRKRKDKRRKKEGGSLGSIYEPEIVHKHKKSESDHKSFELPDHGEKIHVQNEHGIGGNICVKIIFFCLFGLLVGAVGLIYLQSQGSTDVDLPTVEESRFAEYFTGWLDDSNDDHEHESLEQNVDEHDEHEEHEEQDDHDEHDDHDDDEHEKEDQESIFSLFGLRVDEEKEEPEESEMTTSDARESEEIGNKYDEDDENEEDNDDEEEDEEKEQMDDSDEEEEEEEEKEQMNDSDEEEEEKEQLDDSEDDKTEELVQDKDDEDSGIEDEDEDDASQVDENEDDEKLNESKDDNDEDEDEDEEDKEQLDESEEVDNDKEENYETTKDKSDDEEEEEEEEEPDYKKTNDDLGYDEIYESEEDEDESKPEVKEEESTDEGIEKSEEEEEKIFPQVESTPEDDEETEEESGGVAVKLGVGIALVIVAHLVLVQKWKSMSNSSTDETKPSEVKVEEEEKKTVTNLTSEMEPVISRKQTLVPENVSLNDEWEGEEEENEEEELEDEELDEEAYSEDEEVEEEEVKKTEKGNLETFEKVSWDDEEEAYEKEDVDNEEEEEEEEYEREEEEEGEREEDEYEEEEEGDKEDEYIEEEEEEEEENEDEEYEEDAEEETEDDYEDKRKKPQVEVVVQPRREEETTPVPPPRAHKGGRGPQDFEEEFEERFEEVNEVEERVQNEAEEDGSEVEREDNYEAEPEEAMPVERKPGNEDDWAFKQEFDFADEQFENNPKAAVEAYDKILAKKPTVVRALIGRARALDHLAEKEKSNAYLKQAINAYKALLLEHGNLLDDETFIKLSERCIERIRFSGAFNTAIDIHKALIVKFPQTPKYRNALAVTYLMLNRIAQARAVLNETLALWPGDGFALVHYGFILKTSDNNMEEGAKKLMAGIETKDEGVIEGKFFFHLGDALNRLGRGEEAMKWYELGVKEGLFLNKYQRSLYNVNRLRGQPWWTKEETTYEHFFRKLEQNWREIRREGLELLNSKGVNLFKQEAENLKDTGDWRQLDLFFRGKKQATCNKAPITCGLVSSFKPAATCTRGQIKFSVMLPETHVWPHCGPTNCRLRSHLGLVVPKKTYIRVAEETRSWEEGKFIIFDDSFEHEVWHNGTGLRLVLIVDVWHPELTNRERATLSPI